jgi:hypothetical protein
MGTRVDPSVLWLRALVVGALAFVLGVLGHVSADGLLPGPLLLAALLVISVLLSAPMLNRRASPFRLVAMLVGGQTFIHLVLTVTAGHAGDPATAGAHRPATLGTLPSVDGHRVGSLQDAYQGMSGQPSSMAPALPVGHLVSDLQAHAPMMLAHVVAAALVGLWLAYGERCLWTIIALTGRRVLAAAWALAVPVVHPAPRLAATADRVPARPRSLWFVRPHSRRGPPLLLAG